MKYDEYVDVRNRAAEALKNISRGESKDTTKITSYSEDEGMKKAEETFKPQLMALIAGMGLVLIQEALYSQIPINLIFSVSLHFFTSLIFGYLWPKFYKVLGVLVVLPSFILMWGGSTIRMVQCANRGRKN